MRASAKLLAGSLVTASGGGRGREFPVASKRGLAEVSRALAGGDGLTGEHAAGVFCDDDGYEVVGWPFTW